MGRSDGRRVRHADPLYTVVPHLMRERSDSMNNIELFIPVEPMNEYIRKKRAEGINISHLSLVIAAYIRTVAEFPRLNRFVMNRKIYARKGIQIAMVVLKPGTEDGETDSKMNFDPADDIFEVNKKLLSYIDANRVQKDNNNTDRLARFLTGVPGLIRFALSLLWFLDRHGMMPKPVIELSPFHASMTITNLASIRTNCIYHHVYNFGTTGQILSMGTLREIPRRDGRGGIVFDRCIPIGLVMDERLASGLYHARAFKRLQNYLMDPSLLEGAPKVCIREWEDKNI